MLKRIFCLAFVYLFVNQTAKAQDSLNLVQCISYALAHNTTLLRAQNDLQQQTNSYYQAKANLLPTLNGSVQSNFNFGRTVDPATNQFINANSQSDYFSLNADWVIFGGLQKMNQVRQYDWNKDASSKNVQKTKDDISLTVANYYLQILLLYERRKQLVELEKGSSENQKKVQIMYDAGATTLAKKYEADAQLATDQYNIVDIDNQLEKQYLSLKQYINYDMGKPLKLQEVNFQGQLAVYNENDLNKVITDRLNQLPAVQQARSAREAAMYAWRAMKGTAYPRLSFDASLHTIYSSQYQSYSYSINGFQQIGILGFDTTQKVYGPRTALTGSDIPFNDQISRNFGQTMGFTLSIPIFNGLQTKYNIQGAYINYQSSNLQVTDAELKAKSDIYNAWSGMNAARKKYEAGQVKYKSQEAVFKQSDISFKAGAMSYFDYNTARTNYNNAESDLVQAKYEYIFQTKVFEYYLGKPVTF